MVLALAETATTAPITKMMTYACRRYHPETRFMASSNQAAISRRRSATVSAPAWLSARSAAPSFREYLRK